MVIGVDIRCVLEGKRTGVEEYAINLLQTLFKIAPNVKFKLFFNASKLPKVNVREFFDAKNVEICEYSYPNKLLNFSFFAFSYPHIDEFLSGIDLFFMPNVLFSAFSKKCLVISTFHDLSFENHKEFLTIKKRIWHSFVNPRKIARRSDAVIADSYSTKRDLINLYKLDPEKIHIVHLGFTRQKIESFEQKKDALLNKYNFSENFILFLSTIEPRKNLEGVLKSFLNLRKNGKLNSDLVIAGGKGWMYKNLFRLIRNHAYSKHVKILGRISQAEKFIIYKAARAFVFPSYYEGFGLPPLEAMSVGTPVITSSASSLPEVVRDSAILVNPYDTSEIEKALFEATSNIVLRRRLIRSGFKCVENFTWEKCARETLDAFKNVIEKTKNK